MRRYADWACYDEGGAESRLRGKLVYEAMYKEIALFVMIGVAKCNCEQDGLRRRARNTEGSTNITGFA